VNQLRNRIDVALIGTGARAKTVYRLLWPALRERGMRLVAVCDPVRAHADAYANSLGVRPFYSVQELVKSRLMEAAVVVTPVSTHHSISCFLSQNGIHNLCETPMASTLAQAQEMVAVATSNAVVMQVGEQFFRLPFDRIAQQVVRSGFLGEVRRVISTFDHPGYHGNSRWIKLYGEYPVMAQGVGHSMPVVQHRSLAHRTHSEESFHAHFYSFLNNRFVADLSSNPKAVLGRHPRPGYTQIEGERGTIVWRASSRWNGPYHQGEGEVRYCSDRALEDNGIADQVYPIICRQENEFSKSWYVSLPSGLVEYVNEFYRPYERASDYIDFYHAATAEALLEFGGVIRGECPSGFTSHDAVMSMMMDVAIRESMLAGGVQISLPLTGWLPSEEQIRGELRTALGVDPMDIGAMLDLSVVRD